MMMRPLLTDRFVCVVRDAHPVVRGRLTKQMFVDLPHLQIAPRGRPGGYVDEQLEAHGLQRWVARAVPFFHTALEMASRTDLILTVSERMARPRAAALGLKVLEPPIALDPFALSLLWHPQHEGNRGHAWLRGQIIAAAGETAGQRHPGSRKRLSPTDPTGTP